MTITVSISQFRQNIAGYLERVKAGDVVILSDGKKDKQIAQVTKKRSFNIETFEEALQAAFGLLTEENHPEWKTKTTVTSWLVHERKHADRTF